MRFPPLGCHSQLLHLENSKIHSKCYLSCEACLDGPQVWLLMFMVQYIHSLSNCIFFFLYIVFKQRLKCLKPLKPRHCNFYIPSTRLKSWQYLPLNEYSLDEY